MADFANFESSDVPPTLNDFEDDPAADFLAREQDQFAELEGEQAEVQNDFGITDSYGDINQAYSDDFSQPASEPQGQLGENLSTNFTFETSHASDISAPSVTPSTATIVSSTALHTSHDASNGVKVEADNTDSMNGPTDIYSALAQVDRQRQEPEKLKIWREEQKIRLEKKDEEEEEKKEEWKLAAKKEIDDWYKHHDEQSVKAKENNLVSEAAFVKERDEDLPGQQWEKVCRLCEFNPKNSKSTKDVSRLRSILLQLKQSPIVAR